jgi:hypothetical protein
VNRPLRDRLTALLAAFVLLLSGAGDAFGAHPCPHHAAIAAPDHAVRGADHAAADAHHGHAAASESSAPAEHDGHDACTCGGVCPVSTGPAPLAADLTADPLVLAPAAPAARIAEAEALPARFDPHFLPFAQAPPRQV